MLEAAGTDTAGTISPTWAAYKSAVEHLSELRGELAELQMAERTRRVETMARSLETSVKGQERDADTATLDLTVDIINLRARIASTEDLRDFLHDAVTYGVEVVWT